MNLERWFEPAIEMGNLLWEYRCAGAEKRAEIERKIRNCTYISRVNAIQSYSGVDFLKEFDPQKRVNSIKRDYFLNPAVPTAHRMQKSFCPKCYHRHDYVEFIFVLRGKYIQSINGVRHEHKAGDVCMLNPNVLHRDEGLGSLDRVIFMGLSLGFLKGELVRAFVPHSDICAFMENRFGRTNQQYILFQREDITPVEELLGHILEEDEQKLPGHHLIIKGYLVRLFGLLTKNHCYSCKNQERWEIEENLLVEILQYMQENMTEVNRTMVASFFHFNPDYMNRFLVRKTGQNYSAHLRSMRLQAAAEQLKNTDKSVNQIIRELGYTNKGHFNGIFCDKYGMLPGAYRKDNNCQ